MLLLELRNIHKSFGANHVLRGIDLDVEPGEVHALLGANGAGKSTLIKILAGVHAPDRGEIRLEGRSLRIPDPAAALRAGIAVIYQEFAQAGNLTVAENLLLGAEPRRGPAFLGLLDRRRMQEIAASHLERIGFPLEPGALASELSTARKQMLEIATALRREARLLVLDEPTAALSQGEVERLFQWMRESKAAGLGMIYISHHLDEVFKIADRVTVLRDGVPAGTWRLPGVKEADLIQAMAGSSVLQVQRPSRAAGEAVLQLTGFSGPGFDGLNLQVASGEIVVLTGAAGAGHGEALYALMGLLPYQGRAVFRDRELPGGDPARAAAAGVALSPGDRKRRGILPQLPVSLNLTISRLGALRRWGMLDWARLEQEANSLVARCGIRCESVRQPIHMLSGGNQQKVMVGRLAGSRAGLYLFEEPTRGVDVGSREEIYRLIFDLARVQGSPVLVATPDASEARRLGDRILVFREGRVVYETAGDSADEQSLTAAMAGGAGSGHS